MGARDDLRALVSGRPTITEDCVLRARDLGIRVIEVDGSTFAAEVADHVAAHFGLVP